LELVGSLEVIKASNSGATIVDGMALFPAAPAVSVSTMRSM
jgi:hypothetical protein